MSLVFQFVVVAQEGGAEKERVTGMVRLPSCSWLDFKLVPLVDSRAVSDHTFILTLRLPQARELECISMEQRCDIVAVNDEKWHHSTGLKHV